MKKTVTKALSIIILFSLALLQCLSLTAFAEEDGATEWMLSDDGSTLMRSNGKTYYFYSDTSSLELDPSTVYEFTNPVEYGYIYASSPASEIVWVEDTYYGEPYLYATDKGMEQLAKFAAGSIGSYRLCDQNGKTAMIDADTVKLLNESGTEVLAKTVEVEVSTLKDTERYDLYAYDESDTFSILNGAIYKDGSGALYYLNYLDLGNQHFDADGNFSYRSGTVSLVVLEGDTATTVAISLANMEEKEVEYVYEDGAYTAMGEDVFWVYFLLIGFIFPIPFLIIGLVTANSSLRGKPKYWYALSVAAGVWILLSILLLIILML